MTKRMRWDKMKKAHRQELSEVKSAATHEDRVLSFLNGNAQQENRPKSRRVAEKSRSRKNESEFPYYTWPKTVAVGPREIGYHVSTTRPAWWPNHEPSELQQKMRQA